MLPFERTPENHEIPGGVEGSVVPKYPV